MELLTMMGSRESGVGSRESGNVELLTMMGSGAWGNVELLTLI
ncbi:hypothetical protein Q5692_24765 [Microcoleus sp. C2C3]